MPAVQAEGVYVAPEEYLAAEELSETKHEYLDGFVYEMPRVTLAHVRVAGNILYGIRTQLGGSPCEVLGGGVRLKIQRGRATYFYYPDVTVDCSGANEAVIVDPSLIFEVLSLETERNDRGDKITNYQSIPSMRVYVLVDQSKPAVTVYRRAPGDDWGIEFVVDLAAAVALPEIGCALPMATIYERVF
jgi:Uma2 family endonuclease